MTVHGDGIFQLFKVITKQIKWLRTIKEICNLKKKHLRFIIDYNITCIYKKNAKKIKLESFYDLYKLYLLSYSFGKSKISVSSYLPGSTYIDPILFEKSYPPIPNSINNG